MGFKLAELFVEISAKGARDVDRSMNGIRKECEAAKPAMEGVASSARNVGGVLHGLKSQFGRGSLFKESLELLAGGGAIAGIGIISREMGELGEKMHKMAEEGKSFKNNWEDVVPIFGALAKHSQSFADGLRDFAMSKAFKRETGSETTFRTLMDSQKGIDAFRRQIQRMNDAEKTPFDEARDKINEMRRNIPAGSSEQREQQLRQLRDLEALLETKRQQMQNYEAWLDDLEAQAVERRAAVEEAAVDKMLRRRKEARIQHESEVRNAEQKAHEDLMRKIMDDQDRMYRARQEKIKNSASGFFSSLQSLAAGSGVTRALSRGTQEERSERFELSRRAKEQEKLLVKIAKSGDQTVKALNDLLRKAGFQPITITPVGIP